MNSEQRAAVKQRLYELEIANGGVLTPSIVVKDAKSKTSPLHFWFEWDIRKAAASHWLEQARSLITSVRVVIHTETISVDAIYYMRDPSAGHQEQGYRSVERLRSEPEVARAALVDEFTRVADLLRRARIQAAILGASQEVEALLTSVVGLRQRFQQPPAQGQ